MKSLSLYQPHAIAIGVGLKKYETRSWQLKEHEVNVPIAIHASLKKFRERDYDWDWFKAARDRLREAGIPLHALGYGVVICTCVFSRCWRVKNFPGKFDDEFWGDFRPQDEEGRDRFAFEISNVQLIPREFRPAVRGFQKFFSVPDEIIPRITSRSD